MEVSDRNCCFSVFSQTNAALMMTLTQRLRNQFFLPERLSVKKRLSKVVIDMKPCALLLRAVRFVS